MNDKYDWDMPLIPGTIVCARFNSFEGEEKVGLFCVLYDEQMDNMVLQNKNVFAIKLSTKMTLTGNYSVKIPKNINEFLDCECIANCSKIHVLHKCHQVYKVLGNIDQLTMKNIYKTYKRFLIQVEHQLLDRI